MTGCDLPFPSLARRLLTDLASGSCASVIGLSNTGKSTLMRSLAGPKAKSESPRIIIYVDCNQAVATTPQAFYEVVLRTVLQRPSSLSRPELVETLQQRHQAITDANSAFAASLSFNLALTELCEQLEQPICLLIDEFDEIYVGLDDRALLNLRALKDRFGSHLTYITATLRSLPELRGRTSESEFSEMFSHTTHLMPPLEREEVGRFLDELNLPYLSEARSEVCHSLSGGHPGLLTAIAQVLAALPEDWRGDFSHAVSLEPAPRAECLKMWVQLTQEEQADLANLTFEPDTATHPSQLRHLKVLGLVRDGKLFSPVFSDFVTRRGRAVEVTSQGIYLDPDSGDVWVDGIRVPVLTDLEFRLLQLLYERRDKLTDKYRIVTTVWGEDYLGEVDGARVEKLVSRLRSHIEKDPSAPRYLITQRGRGYKLLSKPCSP